MTETTTGPNQRVAWAQGRHLAEGYERLLVPELFAPWGRELVALADLRPGDRVLDVACGTGIIARLAAERVAQDGQVTGIDVHPGMLDVARELGEDSPVPIRWEQASATSIPLPDEAFDVVFCQQGLQFFDDRVAALREMRRVTGPGGRVALSVWRDLAVIPGYAAITTAFEQHAPPAAGFIRAISALADQDELRRLLVEAGWADVHITVRVGSLRFGSVADFVGRIISTAPVPRLQDLDAEAREAIADAVAETIPGYVDDDGLVFPIEAHVATARR